MTHLTCSGIGGPSPFHIGMVQNFSEVSVHLCHLFPMFTLHLLSLLLLKMKLLEPLCRRMIYFAVAA